MSDHIHFIGIGGSGMAPIAEYCLRLGCKVSGSDQSANANTQKLVSSGATVFNAHDTSHIEGAATVVYSSAITTENCELRHAKETGVRCLHRSDLLAELTAQKTNIVIAGTHGKTTTTALISHVLSELDFNPTAIIGGKMLGDVGSALRFGDGDYFVFEADESDGTLVKYVPYISVVTNIDADHLDHYGSFSQLKNVFTEFVKKTTGDDSCTVLGWDNRYCRDLGNDLSVEKLGYGFFLGSDVRAINYRCSNGVSAFTAIVERDQIEVELPLIGKHNVLNALAALSVVRALDGDIARAAEALRRFPGVARRMECIFQSDTISVYDDYAHNPGKIKACIDSLRECWTEEEVTVVFQPHRYSRLETMFEETCEAFASADRVFVLPVYAAGETTDKDFSPETLAQAISASSRTSAIPLPDIQKAHATVLSSVTKPAIILTVGAGDVWQVSDKIKDSLYEQEKP